MSAHDNMSEPQFGPTYYHGSGRDSGPAVTGVPGWDNAGLFVSHDPDVAKLYGPDVERIQMAKDTRVKKYEGAGQYPERVAKAKDAGYDVAEFRKPHDFVGHVIINQDKIARRGPA